MSRDDKPSMHEIDATQGSAADDRFEAILERIKAAGADITKDDETPLYEEMGSEEIEVGERRIVEFNWKGMDFQIRRETKYARITGVGQRKGVQDLSSPQIHMTLKRKPEFTDTWIVVDTDVEDLF